MAVDIEAHTLILFVTLNEVNQSNGLYLELLVKQELCTLWHPK